MAKEKEHPILNYPRTAGRCPKCNHRTGYREQIAACPPGEHCPACGWMDFERDMAPVDFDALPDTRRPL